MDLLFSENAQLHFTTRGQEFFALFSHRFDTVVDSHFGTAAEVANLGVAHAIQGIEKKPATLPLGTMLQRSQDYLHGFLVA